MTAYDLKTLRSLKQAADEARNDLDCGVAAYLRAHGWKYVCNTPGAYWMWEKLLPDGRTVLLHSADDAGNWQKRIDGSEIDLGDEA